MIRKGNLFQDIISEENLFEANKKAQRGKSKYPEIARWNKNLRQNILSLRSDLLSGSYSTSEYSVFTIHEPKERTISKLPFRDRVLHHAIIKYLEPIFTNGFISQSYSCIKKRGIHKCLSDVKEALKDRNGTMYCLKLDIKKFYPSVDNTILKKSLRSKFKDNKLLNLLDNIIDSNRGLPLGNYTSQWFGNYYLNKFDHWLKQDLKIKYYFRYCDDLVILHHDKRFLHDLRVLIQEYLSLNLKLELSNYQVFPVESRGINFVGYVIYHDYIKLRKSIKNKMRVMLHKYPNYNSIQSYKGWTMHANCRNLEHYYLN